MKAHPHHRHASEGHALRRTVRRIFDEEGWGRLELVDAWDGEELDELRKVLGAEEYETLLDRLKDLGEDR